MNLLISRRRILRGIGTDLAGSDPGPARGGQDFG